MKKLLLLLCICITISSSAISQVYYLTDTAFTTDAGYGSAAASCVFTGGSIFGWNNNRAKNQWVADAFTIPAGSTWRFDTVIVYGYLWGAGLTSHYESVNLEIYDGAPGAGGAVIWGDTTANVLAGSGWTGIYRVDTAAANNALNDTDRPIMYLKLYLNPAPALTAGTYWLSWSTSSPVAVTPIAPSKVSPGRANPTGQQARQLNAGTWNYIEDHGKDAGLNMIIKASAGVANAVPVITGSTVSLSQNVPNPFSNATIISFHMAQSGYTKLSVYNAIGQLVATLWDGEATAGEHHVTFDGDHMPAGIYDYQLSTGAGTTSNRMLLVR